MSETGRRSMGGIYVDTVDYSSLLAKIDSSLTKGQKLTITYLNASCFNILYSNDGLNKRMNNFDIIHPDGFGVFLASKMLSGTPSIPARFTGSDFYPLLWESCIRNKRSIFFFGHDDTTLSSIQNYIPELIVAGIQNGYNFNDAEVLRKINESNADILVVGLGYPAQEEWILENQSKLNCRVIICAGEGIKVFAGSKKRGPRFLQTLGLEWLVRLSLNPLKYFKRYVFGIPLFLYRIIIIKIRNLA
ncbi:MAG: WecB/TagA/CpsF family glycosyltransferase [Ignavibacteria bacterium]|nr:WecB/TagA/CpsF family glycosyltransferase [Ignavibacteria bacterium]